MSSTTPELFLCVDCGGSKTAAAISSPDGQILGRGTGGPSNFTDVGLTKFLVSFTDAVVAALAAALPNDTPAALPTALPKLRGAWIGVSGVDSAEGVRELTDALAPLLSLPPKAPELIVANDTHLLASPLHTHADISTAVAVVSGTGSIAVSFRLPSPSASLDELGRVGGWGWLLGDEGGGFHVGRETVREILRRADAASVAGTAPAPSVLRDRVFELYGITDAYDIFRVIYAADPAPGTAGKDRKHRMAQLTPLAFDAAFKDKDELALAVLRTGASELASQIAILLRAPDDNAAPKNAVVAADSILCLGGTLVSIPAYRALLAEALAGLGHVFRYTQFVDDVTGLGSVGIARSASLA